ncbi:MAG: signal peptidase I [Planctomycetes bacterium]|nr:signal peptidase I [Planctomycetota bacterium]
METQNSEMHAHKRRPWVAAFLSLVMPGLGHVYCGEIRNGIVFMLAVTMFSCVWLVGIAHPKTPFLACSVVAWGVLGLALIVAVVDSYRKALRTRYDYVLKDYNHWSVYLVLIWIAGAGSLGYTAFVKHRMFEAFRVPVNAMAPTIMAEDRILVSKMAYRFKNPKRGDVVIFQNPMNLGQTNIKRIVALGQDTIQLRQGQLIINGQPLERDRIDARTLTCGGQPVSGATFWETNGSAQYPVFVPEHTEAMDWGPVTVPPHHCFVLADARNHNHDSRHYGALSLGAIRGKCQTVYWPLRHQQSRIE